MSASAPIAPTTTTTPLTLILAVSLAPLVILGAFVLSSSNLRPGLVGGGSRVGRVDRMSRPRPTYSDADARDGEGSGWWRCEEGVDVEGLGRAGNVFDGCDNIDDDDGDEGDEEEEGGVLKWVVEGFAGFVERGVVGAEEEEEKMRREGSTAFRP